MDGSENSALGKIVERDGKWYVYNHDGTKKLAGPYDSRKKALKRLREIEYFKHQGAIAGTIGMVKEIKPTPKSTASIPEDPLGAIERNILGELKD